MNNQAGQISMYSQISSILLVIGILLLVIAIGMFLRFRIHKAIGKITGNEERKERERFTKSNLEYEKKYINSSYENEVQEEYELSTAEDLSAVDEDRETDVLEKESTKPKRKKNKINLPKETIVNNISESETDVLDDTLTDVLITREEKETGPETPTDILRESSTQESDSYAEEETGLLNERRQTAEKDFENDDEKANRGKFNIVNETVITHGKEKK